MAGQNWPVRRLATAALVLLACSACPSLIVWAAASGVQAAPQPAPSATSGVGGVPDEGVGTVPQPHRQPRPGRTPQPTTAGPVPATSQPASTDPQTTLPSAAGSTAGVPSQPPATSTKPAPGITITVPVPPIVTQPAPSGDAEPGE